WSPDVWTRAPTKMSITGSRPSNSRTSDRSAVVIWRTAAVVSSITGLPCRPRTRCQAERTPSDRRAGQRSADDFDGWRSGGSVHLLRKAHRLIQQRLDDLRLGDGLDDLPPDEDLALAVAGGDTQIRLPGFSRPVDDAAHDRHA